MDDKLIRFGVSIPEVLVTNFDKIIEQKGYKNRSEAIRDLMRKTLIENEWSMEEAEIAATLTLVYDHHSSNLTQEIKEQGHVHHKEILSTLHIHLDEDNCLEVIAMKGSPKTIKHIADGFLGQKGVKHGQLVCTTTGKKIS